MIIEKSKDKHCDFNDFKRARYFHGMLMSERDFEDEQTYHIEKRKLLNRMLHGCGVVCGLEITPANSKCPGPEITIKPGLALDCHGSEIFVCEPYQLNVEEYIEASMSQKELTDQEECDEMDKDKSEETKWYVVIKYNEVPIAPVPVYAPGGGCEEKVCEHSRIREGYCIELLMGEDLCHYCKPPELKTENGPCQTLKEADEDAKRGFLCEKLLMPCPGSCCDDPCVVLGSITLTGNTIPPDGITAEEINNWDERRYVMTFGLLEYWMTELSPQKITFENIADYAKLKEACEKDGTVAVGNVFSEICPETGLTLETTTGKDMEKSEIKTPKKKPAETKKPEAKTK